MDRWGLKGYKDYPSMSEETTCFEATITLDGKPVMTVANRGCGGCHDYRPFKGVWETYHQVQNGDIYKQLEKDVAEWGRIMGAEEPVFEAVDDWVDWCAVERPYGVTAVEHFQEENERKAAFKSPGL